MYHVLLPISQCLPQWSYWQRLLLMMPKRLFAPLGRAITGTGFRLTSCSTELWIVRFICFALVHLLYYRDLKTEHRRILRAVIVLDYVAQYLSL